ncbi:MAG: DUF5946 family protein [Cyclobacteriaceae bacterium]
MISSVACPGCGLVHPHNGPDVELNYACSAGCYDCFSELTAYSLSLGDPYFIHQIAVDTYAAQHHLESFAAVRTNFALIGLCLVVEHGYTGRQVQQVHMELPKQAWPVCVNSSPIGSVTVKDVIDCTAGMERFDIIHEWAESVWSAWTAEHERIRQIVTVMVRP